MRHKVTLASLKRFMEELAAAATSPGKVYFTGGATALLLGFREQTIDIDLKLDPKPGRVFEAIAELKNRLDINVELAAPDDFIPVASNWRESSLLIALVGRVEYFHFDFTMQALAKLERGHTQDLEDVRDFLRGGYVTVEELKARLVEIEPGLLRYPAVDPRDLRKKVEDFLTSLSHEHK